MAARGGRRFPSRQLSRIFGRNRLYGSIIARTLTDTGMTQAGSGSFPSTGVVDNFNRAAIGAAWTTPFFGTNALSIVGSTQLQTAGGGFADGLKNDASYTGDIEWTFAVPTAVAGTSGSEQCMAIIVDSATKTSADGYEVEFHDNGTAPNLFRVTAGAPSQLVGSLTVAFNIASGDVAGVKLVRNSTTVVITVYKNGVLQDTFTDSSPPATVANPATAMFLGVELGNSATLRGDDLGGGTVVTGTVDSIVAQKGYARALTDTLTSVSDNAPVLKVTRVLSDSIPVSDAAPVRAVGRVLADTGSAVSDAVPVRSVLRVLSDTGATVSDSISSTFTPGSVLYPRTATDTGATVTDTLALRVTRPLTDTGATVTDVLAPRPTRTLTDTGATVTESLASKRTRVLSDTASVVSDALAVLRLRVLTDTGATVSDSTPVRKVLRPLTDTGSAVTDVLSLRRPVALTDQGATVSDAAVPRTTRALADALTFSDALARTAVVRALTDSLPVSDSAPVRLVGRKLTDTGASVTDSVARFAPKTLADQGATVSDALALRVAHALADTASVVSDSLVRLVVFARALTDTGSSVTDSIASLRRRVLTDTASVTSDTVVLSGSAARTLTDTGVSFSDSLAALRTVPRAATDTGATVSDSSVLLVGRKLTDTGAALSDSLFRGRLVALTDTAATLSDATPLRKVTRVLTDTGAQITDNPNPTWLRRVTDTGASISDVLSTGRRFFPADTLTITDAAPLRKVLHPLVDFVTFTSDSISRAGAASFSLNDTGATVTDAITRKVARTVADTLTVSDSVARGVRRVLADQGATVVDAAAPVFLVVSGNEITDLIRAAALKGDGRAAPDSSYGIWRVSTNQVPNGGFETDVSTYLTTGGGLTLNRDTGKSKFGSASGRVVTAGGVGAGAYWLSATGRALGAGTNVIGSVWVCPDAGVSVYCYLRITNTDATSTDGPQTQFTGDGSTWFRIVSTAQVAVGKTGDQYAVGVRSVGAGAVAWNMDGVQLETNGTAGITWPTPYIETNGAPVARPASRVTAPSALLPLLPPVQGWVAMRVRMGFPSSDTNSRNFFTYSDGTAANRIHMRGVGASGLGFDNIAGSVALGSFVKAASWAIGDTITVIFGWTVNSAFISFNGSTFGVTGGRAVPTGLNSIEIGESENVPSTLGRQIDSDILWMVFGAGALSNADAATIHAFGDTDPTLAALPGSPTALWTADTAQVTTQPAGAIIRQITRPLSDTGATVSDALVPKRGVFLTDTGASVSDSILRTRPVALTDTGAAISDTLASTPRRSLSDNAITPVTNLLPNGGAEVDTSGWVASTLGGDAAISRSTTRARFGSASFRLQASTGTLDAMRTSGFSYQPNTTYTLSGWFYIEQVGPGLVSLGFNAVYDSGPQHSGGAALNLAKVGEWQYATLTFTTNATAQGGTYVDAPRTGGTLAGLTVVHADGLMLEVGTVAHPYVDTSGSPVTVTLYDQIQLARPKALTDTGATVSDSLASSRVRKLTDTGATVTDSIARRPARVLADQGATITDSAALRATRTLSDVGATVSDSLARTFLPTRTLTDQGATVSDSISFFPRRIRALADTAATIVDAIAQRAQRVLSDIGASVTDSLDRIGAASRILFDTASVTADSLRRSIARVLSDQGATVTDSAHVTAVARRLADSIAISDSVVRVRTSPRAVTDTGATVSDSIKWKPTRALADTGASISDSIRLPNRPELFDVGATISDAIAITRWFHFGMADTLAVADGGLYAGIIPFAPIEDPTQLALVAHLNELAMVEAANQLVLEAVNRRRDLDAPDSSTGLAMVRS